MDHEEELTNDDTHRDFLRDLRDVCHKHGVDDILLFASRSQELSPRTSVVHHYPVFISDDPFGLWNSFFVAIRSPFWLDGDDKKAYEKAHNEAYNEHYEDYSKTFVN